MVRTQIQLTESQALALKRLAAAKGQSMAELIRIGVDVVLSRSADNDDEAKRARARAAAGRFKSGTHDLSSRHDRHLAEILGR